MGRSPSKRGVGSQFGPDITDKFLKDNDLGSSSLLTFSFCFL